MEEEVVYPGRAGVEIEILWLLVEYMIRPLNRKLSKKDLRRFRRILTVSDLDESC